jgi:hypothetical protein
LGEGSEDHTGQVAHTADVFPFPQFLSAGPFEWREQALGVHALPFPPRRSASTSPCSFSSVTSCAAASCDLLVQRGAAPPLVARLLHPQGEGPAQIAADIGHFAIVAFLARSLVLHEQLHGFDQGSQALVYACLQILQIGSALLICQTLMCR